MVRCISSAFSSAGMSGTFQGQLVSWNSEGGCGLSGHFKVGKLLNPGAAFVKVLVLLNTREVYGEVSDNL